MANITYLIGAGASYHSLPLIRTMNARMKAYKTFLSIQKKEGKLKHKFSDQFIKDLNELIEIEKNRTSIDAYARELAINGGWDAQNKLMQLKSLLISYLIFEQLEKPKDIRFFSDEYDYTFIPASPVVLDNLMQEKIKTNIDGRYITFLGKYLKGVNATLPDNIKIISWNYDMQFEATYSYMKEKKLEISQKDLQVYPSLIDNVDINKSCILKLNGTAGLFNSRSSEYYFNHFDLREHKLMDNLDYLIEILATNYNREFEKPLFFFAWENEQIVSKTRQLAKQIIEETNILIVIGYSFPDFNREVDIELLSNHPNLKKIYYQAPKDEVKELIDKLDGVNSNLKSLTMPINNLDTFYIPNEYYLQTN